MSIKKSVIIHDNAKKVYDALTPEGETPKWSSLTNELIEAAYWIYSNSLPDLSDDEWQYIYKTYPDKCNLSRIPYNVLNDVMRQWETIPEELFSYLHGLKQSEQLALMIHCNKHQ